jgi:NAD(P)-dependent dehydrogenase (short-subunit alcohol dehydrogenase family)
MTDTTQRIVITGITGGIAAATARRLVESGHDVVVSARDHDKLDAAIAEIGEGMTGHVMDVTDLDSVTAFFEAVGPFDHLVTPAASAMFAPLREMDFVAARRLIETKQWGQMLCVYEGAKRVSDKGSITLFSGTVTQKPLAGATGFAAAGAATEAAARIWAFELAPVRVNTIVPGIIETPIWGNLMPEDAAKATLDATAEALPVGRVGRPEDLAHGVEFLIGNGFVNGHALVIDGGHRLV